MGQRIPQKKWAVMVQKTKPHSGASNLGKSSLLVGAIACLPMFAELVMLLQPGLYTHEELRLMIFAAIVTLVLISWSLVLAWRAYGEAEDDHWPAATLMLAHGQACGLIALAFIAFMRF